MQYEVLTQEFYDREPPVVAEELLGKLIVRNLGENQLIGKIVETEAYLPYGDPASHSFKGETKRNTSMFGEAGHAYVHRMRHHTLFNVVTEGRGIPGGVLIRGVEPHTGITVPLGTPSITNGPAKVCVALNITHDLDGISLTDSQGYIFIAANPNPSPHEVIVGTRIGITKGTELRLRFYIKGNPHVSRKEKDDR